MPPIRTVWALLRDPRLVVQSNLVVSSLGRAAARGGATRLSRGKQRRTSTMDRRWPEWLPILPARVAVAAGTLVASIGLAGRLRRPPSPRPQHGEFIGERAKPRASSTSQVVGPGGLAVRGGPARWGTCQRPARLRVRLGWLWTSFKPALAV